MPITIQTLGEFVEAHSKDGPPVVDPDTQRELFPDGASRGDMGFSDPPSEPDKLLRAKRRYLAIRLQNEIAAFDRFKQECAEQLRFSVAGGCPPPPPNAKEQLVAGQKRMEKIGEEIAALDREIAALPSQLARREWEERQNQRVRNLNAQLIDIASINR